MTTERIITGYRVFFPSDTQLPEDFSNVDAAWNRRCEYLEQTGMMPYVHTLYLGGPEVPIIE
jgi:hypothetical protein